jgi:hypothetical protein
MSNKLKQVAVAAAAKAWVVAAKAWVVAAEAEEAEEAAKAEPEEYEYELWGAVAGAPGGRWSVTQVNPEDVWPTGVALYVRRAQ